MVFAEFKFQHLFTAKLGILIRELRAPFIMLASKKFTRLTVNSFL